MEGIWEGENTHFVFTVQQLAPLTVIECTHRSGELRRNKIQGCDIWDTSKYETKYKVAIVRIVRQDGFKEEGEFWGRGGGGRC